MANRTNIDADDVLGSNPQHLMPNILRTKIYETQYWLASCFGLNAEGVVDRGTRDDSSLSLSFSLSLSLCVCVFVCICLSRCTNAQTLALPHSMSTKHNIRDDWIKACADRA